MKVKYLDLQKQNQSIKKELLNDIENIIDDCSFVAGPRVKRFESSFAEYCGSKFCVATNSGTAALTAALSCWPQRLSRSMPSRGEALTSPNSFIATSEAISHHPTLFPKFVDVDETCNMNPKDSEIANGNAKVLVPTSLYGNPCDLVSLRNLCGTKTLLINDAAQAHGAKINNIPISQLSDLTCFSFYPGKNLGACGEGGAVATDSEPLYKHMKAFIDHGMVEKYDHTVIGHNYRMTEMVAASLNIKLRYIEEWTEKRIEIAKIYEALLKDNKNIQMMSVNSDSRCVYHIFPIFIKNRESIQAKLNEKDIQTGMHYPRPIHLQSAYAYLSHTKGDFPIAEEQASTQLSLPIYPEMPHEEVEYVCSTINEIL
tara:strand:- start:70832 stop:71944 length:1113 start_codon:yes stop_codon:yes gene_type:complete